MIFSLCDCTHVDKIIQTQIQRTFIETGNLRECIEISLDVLYETGNFCCYPSLQ